MKNEKENLLKNLPQLGVFLEKPDICEIRKKYGDGITKLVARELISELRGEILSGKIKSEAPEGKFAGEIEKRILRTVSPDGRKAVNATGILLHTGLGRAPFCDEAIEQMRVFSGYSILQTDLGSGKRSLREEKIEKMLIELTGCEAATVVNNNAAATMLVLNTLGEGREVIISRGQLIEIGGEFRMPDVMKKSGAILREVGTTNRTHLKDYDSAINENTGAVIHVHTSNYRVRGFAGTPEICELRKILNRHPGIPLIDDIGSGALVPLSDFGITSEPLVKNSLSAGADVVCFSGDKLICGPQSGIICGKKEIIDRIRKNPFARMFRVCKMTIAGLEATLLHFINGTHKDKIPFYRMLSEDLKPLNRRAEKLAARLSRNKNMGISVEDDFAYIGSGSIPDEGIPTKTVKVSGSFQPDETAERLRSNMPSIFCRIKDDSLVFDMRTLLPDDFEILMKALPLLLT